MLKKSLEMLQDLEWDTEEECSRCLICGSCKYPHPGLGRPEGGHQKGCELELLIHELMELV